MKEIKHDILDASSHLTSITNEDLNSVNMEILYDEEGKNPPVCRLSFRPHCRVGYADEHKKRELLENSRQEIEDELKKSFGEETNVFLGERYFLPVLFIEIPWEAVSHLIPS